MVRRPKDKAAGLSPAERTRLWREERTRLGLVKLELWVPPAAKQFAEDHVISPCYAASIVPSCEVSNVRVCIP